ncbi:MAG: ubiquinol-cytochrome C chaperone [Gemmatimonadaceae bacterium]|nr:ubiquinol-cytochrome C chaperone [Acetobacteraceae bacterium]
MAFLGLFGRKRHVRAGYELYTAAVTAAREPYYFETLGVPDTIDGRFDMVGLYVFLIVHRLHAESKAGADLAQAVFDAMFSDMDFNLRELGVGDMTVGKKVRAMWEAFNGRATAYAAPLGAADRDALAEVVAKNVWRGQPTGQAAHAIASMMVDQTAHLARQPLTDLMSGTVNFLPARIAA